MPRNFSRLVMVLGAAFLACAPSLHAQSGQPVRGDVDGDGRVTAADARIVSDFLVGKPVPAGVNVRARGDVNGDGRVTSVDAAIIARAAAGRDMSRFPVGTPAADDGDALAKLTCRVDVRAGTVNCDGDAQQGASPGEAALRVGGVNGTYVKLTSTVIASETKNVPGDSTFVFDVTVQNRIPQSIGTTDNVNPDVDSVRVFFLQHPTATGPGDNGNVTVAGSVGAFSASNQHYTQYPGFLTPGATSPARRFHLDLHGKVSFFSFQVAVAAAVQYPAGWVDIYRPDIPQHAPSPYLTYADTVLAGETVALVDSVRNPIGNQVPGAPVSWTITSHGAASVNGSSGLVTAIAPGVDSVTATSGARTGRFAVVVTTTSTDSTTITAADPTRTVGDSTLVTVQVKDQFGRNVGVGSPYVPAVQLTTTLGTLRGTGAAGPTATPVNVGNGTYTAWLKSTTSGTATVTGTLGGVAIVDNAVVTFTASAPALIEKVEPLATDTVNPGSPVPTAPKVRVKDVHGNVVPNTSVTLLASAGSTVSPPGPLTTNAQGEAAVTSWTINTEGPKTLTVGAGAAPAVVFNAYGNMAPAGIRDSIDAIGNVQITATGLKGNDTDPENETLSITSLTPNTLTGAGGTVTFTAGGGVTYNSPLGFVGLDSATYTVSDPRGRTATGKLMIRVPDRVWYVQGGASGNGRQSSPSGNFTFGGALAAKDSIFLLSSATVPSGVTLPNGGALIGAGAATISRPLGGSPNMTVDPVTLLANGSSPTLTVSSGTGVSLTGGGSGYIVKGLSLVTSAGAGISGPGNFGTLDLGTNQLSISSTGGAALTLSTGTLSGALTSLTASGGTNNVLLTSVLTTGTVNLGASGALSGASGDAFKLDNGNGSFSYAGTITSSTGLAVNVLNRTGGTVTFSGSVSSSVAGVGISVASNSGGAVTFSGDINPVAAGAGISVVNNTGGTYTFSGANKKISTGAASGVSVTGNAAAAAIAFTNGGLTIAGTTGTPFTATGAGTVEVSGGGNTVTVGAAPRAVNLNGITIPAGGITFASITATGNTTASTFTASSVTSSGGGFTAGSLTVPGTAGATSRGIELTSNSAPFTFTTATVAGTAGEGIYLNGNTGAVSVNGGSVATTTGDALSLTGGNAAVTVAATLTKTSAGRVANIGSHASGTVTLSGNLSCTGSCTGFLANGNSGGTIDVTAGTKTFTTGANAAVTLSSNTGTTLNFTGGGLVITTSSGAGFTATGGGTVSVTGSNNTVQSTALVAGGGNALNVQNTNIGAGNLLFKSINATGGTYGIRLENTGSAGGLQVAGDGSTANSGGIVTLNNVTAADSAGVTFNNTANLSLKFMKVSLLVGGASGIIGNNLSGTSTIEKSLVDYNSSAPGALHGAYALRVVNTNTNGTLAVDGTTFQNGLDGEAALSISAVGSSVMTFNLQDSNTGDSFESKFSNIFSGAVVVGAGDGFGTANVHANVTNTKFLNAPSNGINNLGMGVANNGTLVANISNNTFDKVGLPLATVGVININTSDSGRLGAAGEFSTISNNVITNIKSGAGPTFAYDPVGINGYVGIRVAIDGNAGINHKLKLLNNSITGLARQGMIISARGSVNDVNVQVEGNTIGTAAAPVATSNRRGLEVETQSAASMKILIQNNPSIVGAGTSGANSSLAVRAGVTNSSTGTMNATVVSNTIASTNAGNLGRFRGETAAGTTGSSPTMCLDLRNNVLESGTKQFELTNNVGTYNRNASGNTGTLTLTGTIGSVASCTQPSF